MRSLDATPLPEVTEANDVIEVFQGMQGPFGVHQRHAHTLCLRTTPGFEKLDTGSFLLKKGSIKSALARKCNICGKPGAGTKCIADGCDVWFHAVCTVIASESLCQMKAFVVRCPEHPGSIDDIDTPSASEDPESEDCSLEPAVGGGMET